MPNLTMDHGRRLRVSELVMLRILYRACDIVRTVAAAAGFLLAAVVMAVTPVVAAEPAPGDPARAIAALAALVALTGWSLTAIRILILRWHGTHREFR